MKMVDLLLSDEDDTVDSDEEIIYSGHLHWIILIEGFIWSMLLILLALYIPNIFWNWGRPDFIIGGEFLGSSLYQYIFNDPPMPDIMTMVVWGLSAICFALALGTLLYHIKVYFSSRLTITDARLIIKKGLIFVNIDEIEIAEIKEIQTSSGVLGNFLNYGYIHIEMKFSGEEHIACVPKPLEFVKKLHKKHKQSRENNEK